MSDHRFEMIEPEVLKVLGDKKGPDKAEHEGKTYYRFMDFFYTYTPYLDELTAVEVSDLCRARANHPELISQTNIDVRNLFKRVAVELSPKTFLEIGAGSHPIFYDEPQNSTDFIISDADQDVIDRLENQQNKCQLFSNTQYKLHFNDNHFELVMAVFVLHFPFYKEQLIELYRTMSPHGAMIANVYRRTIEAKERLHADMEEAGFKIYKIHDTKELCRDHEYWIIGKDLNHLYNCGEVLMRVDAV
ncbi:methyltransferase domain-containing protein [Pseudomonas fluorescens]|uniref:methyltransferase domain-containing protein n=1 Tax=Pseudomonas fluorescens TaxID=294 RepID=UPI0007D0AB34|nr:methyltransferase domain-containing protein [Pseudomonas fluorescens]